MSTKTITRFMVGAAAALLAATLLAACARKEQPAPQPADHASFASAEQAVEAMIAALEAGDDAALLKLLGPGTEELVSSGDDVADANDRAGFVAAYRAKHELVPEGEGRMILQIGENDWPAPVPLVERDGRWYLDGAEGEDEVIYRRVGRNELATIGVCHGFVDAQNEYASEGRDGDPAGYYAAYLISDEGEQNGLYWPTGEGEPESPAGPFVAAAAGEGYRRAASGEPTPYHGYYYRMLYAQGPNAPGGALEYFEGGRLVNGFALLAWPADYGVSGVQTFMVNQDGVVYQKDLGEDTAAAVTYIELFDPDGSWSRVE
jgi:hypothetical protein